MMELCLDEFIEMAKAKPQKLLDFLENALENPDGVEVSWVCVAAGEQLDVKAIAPMLARIALHHRSGYAREDAAMQLFKCKDVFDVAGVYLEMSKNDPYSYMREIASDLLADLKSCEEEK